jgi:hypothetical protein
MTTYKGWRNDNFSVPNNIYVGGSLYLGDGGKAISDTQKGIANGVATLGADSKVPPAQLPNLAITNIITSGQVTLALYISVEWVAGTIQIGDIVEITTTEGTVELWMLFQNDGDAEDDYKKIDASKVNWANILDKPNSTVSDIDDAVDEKHLRLHAIDSTFDHTSSATSGKMLKADANGLPIEASNTDTEVSTAVSQAAAAIPSSQKGVANGVATLDGNVRVTLSQLPNLDFLGLKRIVEWKSKTQITIKGNNLIKIGTEWFFLENDLDLTVADILDTGTIANGKDYCVYACNNSGTLVFRTSLASTFPAGFDADTSRKIGGFHTLCADVGTISGHPLSEFIAGDILPASVWDLKHRPVSEPAGMVYVDAIDKWVDIYLPSETGANTKSVFGGTISDTRNWMDFVDDGGAVKKRLLMDMEFQIAASGSNEGTNISTSTDPVTTGGHSDTAGRRMISNYGIEDMCGAIAQWLLDQSYRFDGATNHTHQVTVSGEPQTVTSGNPSGDVAPSFSYKDVTGSKGRLLTQETYGDVKLLAGGHWNAAANSGSRGRNAANYRWNTDASTGGRFCSEGKK